MLGESEEFIWWQARVLQHCNVSIVSWHIYIVTQFQCMMSWLGTWIPLHGDAQTTKKAHCAFIGCCCRHTSCPFSDLVGDLTCLRSGPTTSWPCREGDVGQNPACGPCRWIWSQPHLCWPDGSVGSIQYRAPHTGMKNGWCLSTSCPLIRAWIQINI